MYINLMIEENKNLYVYYWLLLITFLVAIMIIVGGLTRLTDSGLSITKWDLFTGVIPPITLSEWERYFSLYKEISEYKLLNSKMTLEQFKFIFWWEYTHRLLGRIIGLFYLVPLIYFSYKKYIDKKYLKSLYFIFFLILIQGLIGWYMVRSGLSERTDVSHYRLSIHLTMGFIIFILLLWNCLKCKRINNLDIFDKVPFYLPKFFLLLIMIQISLGALVSGLDAGQIYQTWPLMDKNYFPDDSTFADLFKNNVFENPSLVQFIHRNVAYFIIIFFSIIFLITFTNKNFIYLRKTVFYVFFALLLQFILGILTVLSGAQIILASMHQIGSILLISTSLILVFKNSRTN